MVKSSYKTWVEVSDKALLHNLSTFKELIKPNVKIMSIVKANAYGHGLSEVSQIVKNAGTNWLGVDNIEEALAIRQLGIEKPILILGYIPPERLKDAIENRISLTVYNKDVLRKIVSLKAKARARVHLKVETGLNRQGLTKNEILSLAKYIKNNKSTLVLEGLSTHFANIEDTPDASFAFLQLGRFKRTIDFLKKKGIKPTLIHCAASAAVLLHQSTHFNMIRLGIALYGLWPSKETEIALSLKKNKRRVELKPVMSLKTKIAQIKTIQTGESVGYGRTWFAPRKSKIGIIPVGYYDGYDRKLSNSGRVLVNGKYAPVVGRVAMNMTMIDLTDIKKAKQGDFVVLIGKSGKNQMSADELATRIGTINYEIVSRINPKLPRVIV